MGVDVLISDGFEVVSTVDLQELFLHQNGLFGSQSDESLVTTEEDDATFSSESPPRETVEEQPDSRQIRSFYFVRQWSYNDPEIKAKIDQADEEIYKLNLARIQITNRLKPRRAERSELSAHLEILRAEHDGLNVMFDEEKKEMEREALARQWSCDGGFLCSSEKELDDLIYRLQYRIQHESISLMEEKQLIKEIKRLEGTRKKVRANDRDSLCETGVMQDWDKVRKLIRLNMDDIKKGQQVVAAKINCLSERLRAIKMEMDSLGAELMGIIDKRDEAFQTIKSLRRQRDQTNADFFQSLALLAKAKELADNRNVKDLEDLANSEVEKFMSLWNSDKAFRDDYEKRILPSLDGRELSRDGRIRDSEDESLVTSEASSESGMSGIVRAGFKRGREDSGSLSSQESSEISYKKEKDAGKKAEDFSGSTSEESASMDLGIPRRGKPQNEEGIVDEKLKEKKREEELAKAREAMERKRRLQEKAAAKAAVRARKEAEKKLKEREKKAKKKAAVSASPSEREETPETVTEASEAEASLAKAKEKHKKERSVLLKHRSFRYRHRTRGADALPKAIMKRRGAANYWIWAISSAAFALVLFLFAFFYVR